MQKNMPDKVLESHKLNSSTFEIWDNGIICLRVDDNVTIELKDSIVHDEFLLNRFDGINQHKLLVESGVYSTISKEARDYALLPNKADMVSATAVVAKSLAHRILINFAIKVTQQKTMKMKMFDNRQKAVEWLLSHK